MDRDRFPGLADGWARLDGPAGTLMLDTAIEAMSDWMRSGDGANHGGAFQAAHRTDALLERTRASVARLLGASPGEIVFGPSMTALTMRFSAAAGRTLQPGDEIVCSRLDHDANVAPWLIAAGRAGATVRFADPEADTLELPATAVEALLTGRTRWVAVTAASNAVGTVPDLSGIIAAAHAAGARVFVDAVHAAPHRRIDVAALDCDALACSAYKWFGPHVGVLWARRALLEDLGPDKLRPSSDEAPDRWELGTLPFESLAGVAAAADFVDALDRVELGAHEEDLLGRMTGGLQAIEGVTLHGAARDRTPTVMFTVAGLSSTAVATALAADGVAVWDGDYYALELSRHLGLEGQGAVRAGCVAYNDTEDVGRLLSAVAALRPAARAEATR
ncbi:MAG: cysteine desulfurase-like protein [Actinomycetota bacterium]|nr:cysteine desulfurase-like protein [Actinomycetota bacterium]